MKNKNNINEFWIKYVNELINKNIIKDIDKLIIPLNSNK